MPSFCRAVGGFVLVFSTVALGVREFAFAGAGALLALVWLIAGQLAAVIDATERRGGQERP
jgi:hypothetical protein